MKYTPNFVFMLSFDMYFSSVLILYILKYELAPLLLGFSNFWHQNGEMCIFGKMLKFPLH